MNHDIAIKVENLSKLYRLGLKTEAQANFGSAVFSFLKSPLSNYRKYHSLYDFSDVDLELLAAGEGELPESLLWAVKDMSFEVPKGQILGIIGHNGAGKSTLLKMLSRITSPTSGRIEMRGRVSSLLEVGTGFHPELTGRENAYLNGTILGMRKKEVDRVFDSIVEFSGIEKFLDTPVKRYSTGMKVRLGFAVAAHLEPEILIVDEVLSVGDAEFQRKCIGKMEAISAEGRTVLFVTHNMAAVTRMCERILLVNDGQIVMDGPADEVVSTYLTSNKGRASSRQWNIEEAPGNEIAKLRAISIRDRSGKKIDVVDIRRPFFVQIEFDVLKPGHVLIPAFGLRNEEGVEPFTSLDMEDRWRESDREPGRYVCRVEIPGNLLAEGTMFVSPGMVEWKPRNRRVYQERAAIAFQVVDSHDGDSARGFFTRKMYGVVRPKLQWRSEWTPATNTHQEPSTTIPRSKTG